eukprot:Gb_37411 [translate_table: standard]
MRLCGLQNLCSAFSNNLDSKPIVHLKNSFPEVLLLCLGLVTSTCLPFFPSGWGALVVTPGYTEHIQQYQSRVSEAIFARASEICKSKNVSLYIMLETCPKYRSPL